MRRLLLATLFAVPMAIGTANAPAASGAPLKLRVALTDGARLGSSTPLRLILHIDRRQPGVARQLRLYIPKGLSLLSSGLGLTACRRAEADFSNVLIDGTNLAGCPANAVIAKGTVTGEIRFEPPRIRERAVLTLLTGPLERGRVALVGLVEGQNPLGALLAYRGALTEPRGRFGGRIVLDAPRIPDLPYAESDVALLDIDVTVGSPSIVYTESSRGRTTRWRPAGPILPSRCRIGTLTFRAEVAFSDGAVARSTTTLPCPPG